MVELLLSLWMQKWLIILITLTITAGAAFYAFLSKPVYEARISVLPPSLSNIAGFNQGRNGLRGLTLFSVNDVYAVFTRNLQTEEVRRQFFKEIYLPSLDEEQRSSSLDRLYMEFSGSLSVKALDKSQPDRYTIVIERHDPGQAADWAKRYIDLIARQSLGEMLKNAQSELSVQAGNIERQIKTQRDSAKARREDRITQLQEALKVAEEIGLEKPSMITGRNDGEFTAFMGDSLMYMRGAKALRAELQVLKSRESDDPFIPNLRDLQEQYELYAGVKLDTEGVAVFRQDGNIEMPDAAIKPRKALILALGVVLGGMLGLFIALIRLMLKKRLAMT
ncbi:LPS O-antigen chain length determinant protein WzzB [Pseudomonas sp. BF-R-30]|uniref:LPS O-antigen chain length determinant protein WzzB n=1 Tax=Pseudomonas sp. BF-R-30 TaxID=2832384 RepID=UPI0021D990E4|nr:Wzz/FepE/Etk N-terminal domain-containing protein [Pseudomonas sp. BF-R-30]